jgi:hypothetical protein
LTLINGSHCGRYINDLHFVIFSKKDRHFDVNRRSSGILLAVLDGGDDEGGRNCGFFTIEQCRATVSGIGGSCEPNLFYPSSSSDTLQSKRKREHAR